MERPRIARSAGYPALVTGHVGPQLDGQAGKGGARWTVVSTIDADMAPDDRFHLRRALALGHAEEVPGDVDDRGPQRSIVAWRRVGRLLQRHQRERQGGWR